jgi:hypothetical protein
MIIIYILILVILIIYICTYYPNITEPFESIKRIININLYNEPNNNQVIQPQIQKPRVIVPLYSPWRTYYPLESVYNYNSNMFYPFYDQYNILGNNVPYIN